MKKFKLLIVTSVFSSLLVGCGMKGPLYRSEKAQEVQPTIEKAQTMTQTPESDPVVVVPKITKIESIAPVEAQQIPMQNNVSTTDSIFTPRAQLFAVSADHFTLQLAALDSQQSLDNFINTHNLPQPHVSIYQTMNNNKPRYIIIFGEYTSRQSAKIASQSLPGTLANMETWVKTYQRVHQDLLLNN